MAQAQSPRLKLNALVSLTSTEYETTVEKVETCAIPRIENIIQGYVKGGISDEENALKDLLTDIFVMVEYRDGEVEYLIGQALDAARAEVTEAFDEKEAERKGLPTTPKMIEWFDSDDPTRRRSTVVWDRNTNKIPGGTVYRASRQHPSDMWPPLEIVGHNWAYFKAEELAASWGCTSKVEKP